MNLVIVFLLICCEDLFRYLKGRVAERDKSSTHYFTPKWPHQPELSHGKARRQDFHLGLLCEWQMTSGHCSAAFRGALTGSWINSRVARTHVQCWHHRQPLNLAQHSIVFTNIYKVCNMGNIMVSFSFATLQVSPTFRFFSISFIKDFSLICSWFSKNQLLVLFIFSVFLISPFLVFFCF